MIYSFQRVIGWVLARLDACQRRRHFFGFGYAVVKKYREDEAGHSAALLAYYGFLSLFPFLLVLTSVLKLLLHNDTAIGDQLIRGAVAYFPIIGRDLQQDVHGIGKTGFALAAGLLLTLFGARGGADAIRSSLDRIWEVPHVRRSAFPRSLLRNLCIIIVGGIGLVLAPAMAGYVLVFGHEWFLRLASVLLTMVVLFWVLIFVVKMGVSTRRPFREIWVGAALAAVGLEILQTLGGLLVTRELQHLDDLYGTFAIVLGLFYWIYLQTQLLLYAFELDSVRVHHLWPRSLTRQQLTSADHQAYALYVARGRFHEPGDSQSG